VVSKPILAVNGGRKSSLDSISTLATTSARRLGSKFLDITTTMARTTHKQIITGLR
jgi:hypothetical protein